MIWFILGLLALIVAVTLLFLRGRNLSYLGRHFKKAPHREPSSAHQQVLERVKDMHRATAGLRGKARIRALREYMDSLGAGLELRSEIRPTTTPPAPKGEWVIAPGASCRRRILYIHGGAWIAGSPKSHRSITDRLSRLANAAVFALDYRLMPENRYMDGIKDCREAYQWLLENGPEGAEPVDFLVVAGDSAGGSHTLGLIAWVRDQGLRAPDAAVALSPSTDLTLTAPSYRANMKTDPMLGPSFAPLLRLPLPLVWWAHFLGMRVSPANPLASPLRGNLANLPPTLIHASESEMLLDNARWYAQKARDAGSPVELETWPGMVHVWHIFTPLLPEAEEAYQKIGTFLSRVEAGA